MKDIFSSLEQKKALSSGEMSRAMEQIMSGQSSDEEIERFLLLLKEKGESVVEIAAAAKVMRAHSVKLSKTFSDLVDTCGTGGDGRQTLNVSTLAAIVAASVGVKIGKHGNRAVSSRCGSADLLELLGIKIELPVPAIENCIEKTGFGFFFAPQFHPAVRFAMPARRKIKEKTIFNILGPLSNPAGASRQVIGVYDKKLVLLVAQVLVELGVKRALVVHGANGLDEISAEGPTSAAEVNEKEIRSFELNPDELGIVSSPLSAIQCDSAEHAKKIALEVLSGSPGAAQDIVAVNAGAVIYIAGKTASIQEGVGRARQTLQKGAAFNKLKEIVSFTNQVVA